MGIDLQMPAALVNRFDLITAFLGLNAAHIVALGGEMIGDLRDAHPLVARHVEAGRAALGEGAAGGEGCERQGGDDQYSAPGILSFLVWTGRGPPLDPNLSIMPLSGPLLTMSGNGQVLCATPARTCSV